jgi:hypothetical protein
LPTLCLEVLFLSHPLIVLIRRIPLATMHRFGQGHKAVVWAKSEVPALINEVPIMQAMPGPEERYHSLAVAGRLADATTNAQALRALPGLGNVAFVCDALI